MVTQLADLRRELTRECARVGHKMQDRRRKARWVVRRCVVCGEVETYLGGGGPLTRLDAWLTAQSAARAPWPREPGYPGPLEPPVQVRLVDGGEEIVLLHLLPLTWRVQSDGRFTELGRLGGDIFRVIWRDYHARRAALIGGWPAYERRYVAEIRIRVGEPVEAGGHVVHGDITVARVSDLTSALA